jgi:beta-lactam-binding protein with PASTA domain
MGVETIKTPSLAGHRLQDVIPLLSSHQLNLRILEEVEDPLLPEGTVIKQKPEPDQVIKRQQAVGVVISRKPSALTAPHYSGLKLPDLLKEGSNTGIRVKYFPCESFYPKDECVAQYPSVGSEVQDKTVIAYISSGPTPLHIVPDFRGLTKNQVLEAVVGLPAKIKFFPQEPIGNDQCKVITQKPLAGSFVDINHAFELQLQTECS